MNVLLTGASGFLGNQLISRLLAGKHVVTVLGRRPPQSEGDVTFIQADITNKQQLESAKQQIGTIDCVIHLAGAVPKTKEEDRADMMFATNEEGTKNVLETFGPGLKNFVYASTAEVYGLPETTQKINEKLVPHPISNYGASKLAGERVCEAFGGEHGLPVAVLRFSVMYGPGDTINRAVPNFIKKALKGENLEVFGGEEMRDYLHLDDAIEALYLAATKRASGIFNIGSGEGISVRDTAELIIKKVNPKLRTKILPRQKKASDIVLDISRANAELGFNPMHIFPDKLEEQITWHKQNP